MAYKLSERHLSNHLNSPRDANQSIHLGQLAGVFLVFGLVSLVTALIFSGTSIIEDQAYSPSAAKPKIEIGPILVKKFNESYSIDIQSQIPMSSWSVIEGQVLNEQKVYLFGFSEELWREQGRDSDGYWEESNDRYSMDMTFPDPGVYYLNFITDGSQMPENVNFKVYKRVGSSIPHLWFGLILMVIGIVMNEIQNKTIAKTLNKFES